MKLRFVVFVLFVSLLTVVQARATLLPSACGDNRIRFDVNTTESKLLPAPPPEGKAQIVFIENENQAIAPFMYATVRFGMDGAWVGASNNNSYFIVTVDPGVHHVCASWQTTLKNLKKSIDVASFTAEPGKIYYFAANLTVTPVDNTTTTFDFNLLPTDEDEGKYRVKAWKLASWKSNN